ncbi:MAG: trypsin-like peptidase domain-containing protein [Actinomycetota bacterium]
MVTSVSSATLAACGVVPAPPSNEAVGSPPSVVTSHGPTPVPAATSTRTPERLVLGFTRTEQAALRVRNVTCQIGLSTGTGVAIGPNLLVTNRHVVEGAKELQLERFDGRKVVAAAAAVIYFADLAILQTEDVLPVVSPLASRDPPVGTRVTVVGYPYGGPMVTTSGSVLGYQVDPMVGGTRVMVNDASIRPGSSGSAVYDESDAVVGIAYAGSVPDGPYLAVPVSALLAIARDPSKLRPLGTCRPG